jgi:hypothetical protein
MSAASLRAGADHLKAIYDTVNEAIFVRDAETGRILDCNQRACKGEQSLLGRNCLCQILVVPSQPMSRISRTTNPRFPE